MDVRFISLASAKQTRVPLRPFINKWCILWILQFNRCITIPIYIHSFVFSVKWINCWPQLPFSAQISHWLVNAIYEMFHGMPLENKNVFDDFLKDTYALGFV